MGNVREVKLHDDGSASVGSPSFDILNNLIYVGAEGGAVYAVTVP